MPKKRFTDQIRAAVSASGKTRYRLWKETGISQATLSRFMSRERGISLEHLDRLADVLHLSVKVRKGR